MRLTLLIVLLLALAVGLLLADSMSEPDVHVEASLPPSPVDGNPLAYRYVGATTTTTVPPTTTTQAPKPKRKRMVGEWPWDAVAQCESGGDWSYNGPSGFDGGLQFHPRTWSAYAPSNYPRMAYEASREQQIVVAQLVLADQGWGAWPTCSRKLGLR